MNYHMYIIISRSKIINMSRDDGSWDTNHKKLKINNQYEQR